jgi:hypothetical protein
VWLLGLAWLSLNLEHSGPTALYRFDPQTLRLISERTVGAASCGNQATLTGWTGGRLWLSTSSAVRLIRPVPWTVLQTEATGHELSDRPDAWLSLALRTVAESAGIGVEARKQSIEPRPGGGRSWRTGSGADAGLVRRFGVLVWWQRWSLMKMTSVPGGRQAVPPA